MSYVFYPGCSMEGTSGDYRTSTLAVAQAVGLDLPEIPDWICCGSTSAHQSDPLLSLALPATTLLAAKGTPVVVCCASCYARLKTANYEIAAHPEKRRQVAEIVGADYDGSTPVLHLLEVLVREVGLARVLEKITAPLRGLKVASYYGCLLSRPGEITNFDEQEDPTLMDQLMTVAGATALDWPHKTECCGAAFSITNVGIVHELTTEILQMARAAGADCIVAACPLCQINLDLRQKDIEARTGQTFNIPVFYFTQLLGLAMGIPAEPLRLRSLVVDPMPLLEAKGLGPFAPATAQSSKA